MSILTLDLLKDHLQITGNDDDAALQSYVDGINAAIEDYKHEVIAQRTITERITVTGCPFRLWQVPVISLTSLTPVGGDAVDITGVDVDPESGLVYGSVTPGRYVAVYEAGYSVIPQRYVQGALVIAQHVWETQRGTAGVPTGVIGPEEYRSRTVTYTIPRKALEWLGSPRPVVA